MTSCWSYPADRSRYRLWWRFPRNHWMFPRNYFLPAATKMVLKTCRGENGEWKKMKSPQLQPHSWNKLRGCPQKTWHLDEWLHLIFGAWHWNLFSSQVVVYLFIFYLRIRGYIQSLHTRWSIPRNLNDPKPQAPALVPREKRHRPYGAENFFVIATAMNCQDSLIHFPRN